MGQGGVLRAEKEDKVREGERGHGTNPTTESRSHKWKKRRRSDKAPCVHVHRSARARTHAHTHTHTTTKNVKDAETKNDQEKRLLLSNILPGGLLWDCPGREINCVTFSPGLSTGDEVRHVALVPEAPCPEPVLLRHSASQ